MDLGLNEARVVVTGGASNIGRAIVHAFAGEGSRVLVADIDERQGARVVEEAQGLGASDAAIFPVDVTDTDAGSRIVADVVGRWGGIDVLVNNAGGARPEFFSRTSAADWRRIVDLNLMSAFACSHAVLEPMQRAGSGSIVFTASDSAFGEPRTAVYGAAKAGLIAFARSIAKEHGRDGIRANVVCPGVVVPDPGAISEHSLWSAGRETVFDEKQLANVAEAVPLRRFSQAADVAASAVWFSSPTAARQLTGQVVSVSGGFAMP